MSSVFAHAAIAFGLFVTVMSAPFGRVLGDLESLRYSRDPTSDPNLTVAVLFPGRASEAALQRRP